ncbi:hypothetical protein A3197_14985 [Candidatus Thiodiazotropha endoloripes]|nr:hypothetical protein A3197_14985 [Candidatus Thiodiazotropha endoloripes]
MLRPESYQDKTLCEEFVFISSDEAALSNIIHTVRLDPAAPLPALRVTDLDGCVAGLAVFSGKV